jgi:hypothetical protein
VLLDVCAPAAVASPIASARVRHSIFHAFITKLLFKSQNGDAELDVVAP